jgi:hypothetical protein
LQPLEVFLDHISDLIDEKSRSNTPVNLSHWLENVFETGWQIVESLFSSQTTNPALSVRSKLNLPEINGNSLARSIRRAKLIDLGIRLANTFLVLIVKIAPTECDRKTNIRLQVYPTAGRIYLPPSLQLIVLDEGDVPVPQLEAQARSKDICIQLEFNGEQGEKFNVKLALGDVNLTEHFII